MKNRGITLIELMIVVGVLGIIFNIRGINTFVKEYKSQQTRIVEQQKVLFFYKYLRKLLKESKELKIVTPKKLETDKFKLMISNNNEKIFLNGKVYAFNNFKMLNLKRAGDSVICDVLNGNHSFNFYFVLGKAETKKPSLQNDNVEHNYDNNDEGFEDFTLIEEAGTENE